MVGLRCEDTWPTSAYEIYSSASRKDYRLVIPLVSASSEVFVAAVVVSSSDEVLVVAICLILHSMLHTAHPFSVLIL